MSEKNDATSLKEVLIKISEKLKEKKIIGEIKDEEDPLVVTLRKEEKNLPKSKIKYSYINAQAKWKELKIEEKNIYLFRITYTSLDDKIKNLIRKEYQIHANCPELNDLSPQFICYYFSKNLNFSLFFLNDRYFTLEEILSEEKIQFDKDSSFLQFTKEEMIKASLETIKKLQDKKYYICPFLTPSYLLCVESREMSYFYISEIFLETDTIEEEKEIDLISININSRLKNWVVPEFNKNKAKLSFPANIYCLGKIVNAIALNKSNQEINEFKKLIDVCTRKKKEERWSIEKIETFINNNNFEDENPEEEEQKEINNKIKENDNIELEKNEASNEEKKKNNDINKTIKQDKKNEIQKSFINKVDKDLNQNIFSKSKNNNENRPKIIQNKDNNEDNSENQLNYDDPNKDSSIFSSIFYYINPFNYFSSSKKSEKEKEKEKQRKLEEENRKKKEKTLKEELLKKEREIEKESEKEKQLEKAKLDLIKEKKRMEEQHNQEKERLEMEEIKKNEERNRKKEIEIEEEKKREKETNEKIERAKIEIENKKNNNKMLSEQLEKGRKELEEKREKGKIEIEAIKKDIEEKERIQKEKEEKELKEKEQKEKELKEKLKKEEEEYKKKREEEKKLQRQLEAQKKEEEYEEKRRKDEKERIKKEEKEKKEKEEHAKNFPEGIASKSNDNTNTLVEKEIKFVHLEIKFKKEKKDLEIFDIFGPSKPGYKLMNFENNKYYIVFPFYKTKESNKIILGIRDAKNKEFINDEYISGNYLKFSPQNNHWKLTILISKQTESFFNIYNVPKEINNLAYLKFLYRLNLKNYEFTYSFVSEATNGLKYFEILELIMEIGINQLSEKLIRVLINKKVNINVISQYLEKNKNTKFKNNFHQIAPNIIYLFNSENITKEENNEIILEETNHGQRKCLLCFDNNVPISLYPNNYQKDLIDNTIKNLGKSSLDEKNIIKIKKALIQSKLIEYNKNQKLNGAKEITCILTHTTVKKLTLLEKGILANIPMIIQGFTSAGKSFLSSVACKINKRECLTTALSENTTIEDLLGRDVIKNDSSIRFIPGILLLAYKDGKTLILDECDLAKPEILSCILGSMTKNELIICNQTFRKMEGYNVILTMNGEVKGFNEKQRNILTSNILSKFIIIPFEEMEKEECQEIFKCLLNEKENSKDYINNIGNFIEIHQEMINNMKENEETSKNKNNISIDPIVTLRNLKYCCYLGWNLIHPRIAAEISYTARFPKNERAKFENILNNFGKYQVDINIKEEIEKNIKKNFLFYNDTYKKVVYLAFTAIKEGLHPLLIGEKGIGLTTLARLVASMVSQEKDNYEFLLCTSETSVEDLIGCYQPKIKFKENIQNLSSYIHWNDGPVIRAGKKGVPLILDNINYSRPQIIECLNPILEENSKYNTVEYNILEKENEGAIQMKKNFVIIATMNIDKNNENKNTISKALMNRFVAIYLDNDLDENINQENLSIIIENTGKKLDRQIKELYKNQQNNNEHIKEELKEDLEKNEENEEIERETKEEENKEIPEWYNIKGISDVIIKEVQNYFLDEKIEIKGIKKLIKKIKKLTLVYQRIKIFGFSIKDCEDLINLKFNGKKDIYDNLLKNILIDSNEEKNKFFFDDFNSESWKMIMSLISSLISNNSIFLQGSPGSGKSCAARHFGAYRIFQNRNPILSVNCHRDLKFEYLVGNYNFKNSKFNYVDGPLLTAMKKGESILLDEFNLCPENVLINLLPIFKANINEKIYLKGVPESIRITPGFLLIATGNQSKEKGRNTLSSSITEEILIKEISSLNLNTNATLIKNILEKEYKEIYQEDNSFDHNKISSAQIKKIDEDIKDIIQYKLSFRQIKCLLERICRFCLEENYDIGEFKKIPVIYVIISYIIPQIKIGPKKLKEFLKKLDETMRYNNPEELISFIDSKVEFETTYIKIGDKKEKKTFIKKGKIYLVTNMNEDKFPQVVLQTYFWIRMSCALKNESPSSENILLAGTTSYKEYLLHEWLSLKIQKEQSVDTVFLTKNTETENLIGTSSLDDEKLLEKHIKYLIENTIFYFQLYSSKIKTEEDYKEKLSLIKKIKK